MKTTLCMVAGVGLLLGCPVGVGPSSSSSSSSGGPTGCTPGIQQVCPCAGGGQGVQACNAAGTGFDACQGCPAGSSSYTSNSASSGVRNASSLTHGTYTFDADTVTDSGTGLTWQRAVPPDRYTWSAAKAYCTGLSLAGTAPWRLPWSEELDSIVDHSVRSGPTINATAFPNTPPEGFWSASPFANNSNNAWYVHFNYGYTSNGNVFNSYSVR